MVIAHGLVDLSWYMEDTIIVCPLNLLAVRACVESSYGSVLIWAHCCDRPTWSCDSKLIHGRSNKRVSVESSCGSGLRRVFLRFESYLDALL